MASPMIPPLRYQKGGNGSSPTKVTATGRPLSELSPMAIRRNSPSFPQSKGALFKNESSPAGSSPFSINNVNSPLQFWKGRDTVSPSRENKDPNEPILSSSPTKRSSIENLKKASRVKNSTMFAKEQETHYDPSRPNILDGRPLSTYQGNAFGGRVSETLRNSDNFSSPAQSDLKTTDVKDFSPMPASISPPSPSKLCTSPAKSSLSKKTGANMRYSGFDPDSGIWEDEDDDEKRLPEGRGLHRHAKSVTFDQAPPQINEYEMTTPVPSSIASGSREGSYEDLEDDDEEELSFERGSSMDHDDSFDASLEDTDKTPVVLPEDWRFMSPDLANTDLAQHQEDVFDDDVGSPEPNATPGRTSYRPHQTSVNSVDSNGQPRPLPPLPAALSTTTHSPMSRDSLSGAIERMSSGQRALPFPPPAASMSKSDLRRMSAGSLSVEERLRLMLAKEQEQQAEIDVQRERRMRRAGSRDLNTAREEYLSQHDEKASVHETSVSEDDIAPRLSRLSISQQLRGASSQDEMNDFSKEHSQSPSIVYDPDVPIPSLEDPTQRFNTEVEIKAEEDDDDAYSLASIPSYYGQASESQHENDRGDDEMSEYSQPSDATQVNQQVLDQGHETPRAQSPAQEPERKEITSERMSLPEFTGFGYEDSFDLGLDSYMTPPSATGKDKPLPMPPAETVVLPDLAALRETIQRPYTPEEQLEPPKLSFSGDESSLDPGTPNSVIRHPVSVTPEPEVAETDSIGEDAKFSSRNAYLKSRSVSNETTQTDSEDKEKIPHLLKPIDLVEQSQKRVSSLVRLELPTGSNDDGLGLGLEEAFDRVVEAQKVAFELSLQHLYHPFHGRFPSGEIPASKDLPPSPICNDLPRSIRVTGARTFVDMPSSLTPFAPHGDDLFANRRSDRQRGYLMRQNTKIVVASERSTQDEIQQSASTGETDTPGFPLQPNEVQPSRKASQPTWTAEPWNPKPRRKSIKLGGEKAIAKRKPVSGPVPPLPGMPSNVDEGLVPVTEDELAEEEAEDFEDGVERGRLFVKVVGIKDLQLPFPQRKLTTAPNGTLLKYPIEERTYFALTLDNGLHCVTTTWLDLARNAPIGQEFELVVLNELEFQLTLQMKLEEPKVERPVSPTKPPASPKKQGAFGRLFGSPKKKKEIEARASDVQARRPVTPPSAYEMVQGLVAKDGSFARAYISLNEHEKYAYGRPYSVDIKCFNEWAMEQVTVGSSRSKKSVVELQRRPPYEIGKLELQLMYVPKPKGSKEEDMPKSMNSAIRALREAEEKMKQHVDIKEFEGYLNQQGGDCPFWRRRFFKLVGTKLTAYHETTLQPRATINLAKATKLINDKSALTQKETSTKGGGRRKSAFAEEEDGYMFVEEGFRIRFANGEMIDFYADSTATKELWMAALSQVIGKGIKSSSSSEVKGWTEMVLKREKINEKRAKADVQARKHQRADSASMAQHAGMSSPSGIPIPISKAMPPLPRPNGHARSESYQSADVASRSTANSPVKTKMTSEERRQKARSMAF